MKSQRLGRLKAKVIRIALVAVLICGAWLMSRIPGMGNRSVRLTAACIALACAILNLVYLLLKGPVKDRKWLKRIASIAADVSLLAAVIYLAGKFAE